MLQVYSTPIPSQLKSFDWLTVINSKDQSKEFIEAFLTGGQKLGWKIYDHEVKKINGNYFLEVRSSITNSGMTQKQMNWLTVYNGNYINIIGATLKNSFDENVRFIKSFANSVKLK